MQAATDITPTLTRYNEMDPDDQALVAKRMLRGLRDVTTVAGAKRLLGATNYAFYHGDIDDTEHQRGLVVQTDPDKPIYLDECAPDMRGELIQRFKARHPDEAGKVKDAETFRETFAGVDLRYLLADDDCARGNGEPL